MLTAEEMRRKVYKLADDFETYYKEKKFYQAKAAYDEASLVAVFMELPQEDMYELFRNHNESEEKNARPVWGRFNMDKVRECYWWCIQRNLTKEKEHFHYPGEKTTWR